MDQIQLLQMSKENKGSGVLAGDALRRAIREAIGKHLDLRTHEVFIFGSEALGTGTARSDIDIGIRGPRPLNKAILQRIREDLEKLRTLRIFDVVDFASADPSFAEVALQKIEKI